MVHNIHNLLHLCNDVRKFGHWNFSNFAFENYLGQLKKNIDSIILYFNAISYIHLVGLRIDLYERKCIKFNFLRVV